MRSLRGVALVVLLAAWLPGAALSADTDSTPSGDEELVQLDLRDVELSVLIDTIARLTKTNFIYDDRVRGRVTIVSPRPIPLDEAYAVFESVLHMKGFTTVVTPGGAVKVIPSGEARQSAIETVRDPLPAPDHDGPESEEPD